MTSVYVEVIKKGPCKPRTSVKGILINVIDVWQTPESECLKYSTLQEEGNAFCKFLNVKLKQYQAQGAYINFAIYDNKELNQAFNSFPLYTRIGGALDLYEYFMEKKLKKLVICGQHLHECVLTRETGYNEVKMRISNIAVAPTLSRAYPPDLNRELQIEKKHYIYL